MTSAHTELSDLFDVRYRKEPSARAPLSNGELPGGAGSAGFRRNCSEHFLDRGIFLFLLNSDDGWSERRLKSVALLWKTSQSIRLLITTRSQKIADSGPVTPVRASLRAGSDEML